MISTQLVHSFVYGKAPHFQELSDFYKSKLKIITGRGVVFNFTNIYGVQIEKETESHHVHIPVLPLFWLTDIEIKIVYGFIITYSPDASVELYLNSNPSPEELKTPDYEKMLLYRYVELSKYFSRDQILSTLVKFRLLTEISMSLQKYVFYDDFNDFVQDVGANFSFKMSGFNSLQEIESYWPQTKVELLGNDFELYSNIFKDVQFENIRPNLPSK